jgi:hypothetical protein
VNILLFKYNKKNLFWISIRNFYIRSLLENSRIHPMISGIFILVQARSLERCFRVVLRSIHKGYTTPFGYKITFFNFDSLANENLSLHFHVAYTFGKMFTNLILLQFGTYKFVAVWTSRIDRFIGEGKYFLTHFVLGFVFTVGIIRMGGRKIN